MSRQIEVSSEKQGKTGLLVWLVRLFVFAIVLIACLAAALFLLLRWQDAGQGGPSGSVNLNLVERLYLGSYLATKSDELAQPIGAGTEAVRFVISPGENADQIASALEQAGLLKDPELFLRYVRYHGLDAGLEAGTFRLSPQHTLPELAVALTDAKPQEIELRFLEGWRLEEMANYLRKTQPADIDGDEFLAITQGRQPLDLSGYAFLASLPPGAGLEGFLFPDTYRVALDADAQLLVKLMLENFGKRATPEMRQGFGNQGLTVFEAVTLASIVQREAVIEKERPLMTGVFINRLNQGMQLQADPTVQYALGYQPGDDSWWKAPLSRVDLQVDSGYNTYVNYGLPPGPISNPGLASLEAVANPADTPFFFFVVDCTASIPGTHIFSETFEEHLSRVERCR